MVTVGVIVFGFVEEMEEAGKSGIGTGHPNVFICDSAAKRGGAVNGTPGHNTVIKVLEMIRWTS